MERKRISRDYHSSAPTHDEGEAMRKSLLLSAFAVLLTLATPARAQFCPGAAPWVFDDVPVGDPFCGYITWMAQNGITGGCQAIDANHRLYCPNDSVSRSQMAAFMSRLGTVAVPTTVRWGNFVAAIPGGASQFVFAGNSGQVTIPPGPNKRIVAAASGAMGLFGVPGPIGADVALCFQVGGVGPLTSFNSAAMTATFTNLRNIYAVNDSMVFTPGTYNIGLCVLNASANAIDNNDRVSGWAMVVAQ